MNILFYSWPPGISTKTSGLNSCSFFYVSKYSIVKFFDKNIIFQLNKRFVNLNKSLIF